MIIMAIAYIGQLTNILPRVCEKPTFLGEEVIKYHKTLTTYLSCLIKAEFEITGLAEPKPAKNLLYTVPGMLDELRRPMILLVSARKKVI